MTDEQKKFILEELNPFILRDHGLGFHMAVWNSPYPSTPLRDRPPSACRTLACIGGSIEILQSLPRNLEHWQIGERIGLNHKQTARLFLNWNTWPTPYAAQFREAVTPLAQAVVATELLKAVAETRGRILDW